MTTDMDALVEKAARAGLADAGLSRGDLAPGAWEQNLAFTRTGLTAIGLTALLERVEGAEAEVEVRRMASDAAMMTVRQYAAKSLVREHHGTASSAAKVLDARAALAEDAS